ncbi:MAG TPA: hypothetical protein VHS55_02955 [Solirubrobacteraceae bacterium]|jgi:hypothetical protein|nr:hypothetical protein [Solirubrobacteraceae bacterium]
MVTLAAPLAVQSSAQARIPCRPGAGTVTLAHSSKARIFEYNRDGNDYACLYSNGHARYLSGSEHYEYRLVRFAGPYVAYVENIAAVDDHIGVVNLSTGNHHSYQEVRPIENSTCPQVDSLVLKGDGAVAWIGTNFLAESFCVNPPGPAVEVRRHDRRGLRTIDSGVGVVPTSLQLSGSQLRWTNAGHVHFATLL